MRLDSLYPRQSQTCITCPAPPACNCPSNQDCIQINRDCMTCGSFRCVTRGTGGPSTVDRESGLSKGALAGAVVGSLVLLAIAISLFLWYRRRGAFREKEREPEKDIPAPAATVLNRPDPTDIVLPRESTAGEPDAYPPPGPPPKAPSNITHTNPFEDHQTIHTTATEGSNVIPIALVSPAHTPTRVEPSSPSSQGPMRPARSRELNLNLDHVNVSRDSFKGGAPSQRSGISSRMSYMSNASYGSDFLNEAPAIITPNKAAVRQVLGVVKAEVIHAPGSTPSTPSSTFTNLKPPLPVSRPSVPSPLAGTSFGPADIAQERDEQGEASNFGNPFSDDHSPFAEAPRTSLTSSEVPPHSPAWSANEPRLPWAQSRPTSTSTQADSIIADIESATRVYVGPSSAGLTPVPPYRTAVGKLVAPSASHPPGTLQEQQQRALAHAQARARAQVLDVHRRESGSSVVSSVSTRADSILESFPFVPPSPISDRPIRSPVSPLAEQSSNQAEQSTPRAQQSPPASPLEPPNRHFLGLSTASQLSTASSGLGSFPFQIESVNSSDLPNPSTMSSPFQGQRASLDTITLTNDLSSYPLAFGNDTGGDLAKR